MENNLYDHYNEIPDFDEYEDRNRRGQRTPREPRDWRGNVVKVIVSICLMLFTIYALIMGLGLLAKSIKGSSYKDLDLVQELHKIEREDKKTEPDGKIVLSDKYLTVEYKRYLSGRQNSAATLDFFAYGFSGLVIFICILSFGILFIGSKFDLKKSWKNLLPVPFILAFIIAYNALGLNKRPPEPEEVRFFVGTYEFTRKTWKSRKDDDGDYTYKYYIYYKNDSGTESEMKVTESKYKEMKIPGKYYIATAVNNGQILEYWVYDMNKYKTVSDKGVKTETATEPENESEKESETKPENESKSETQGLLD